MRSKSMEMGNFGNSRKFGQPDSAQLTPYVGGNSSTMAYKDLAVLPGDIALRTPVSPQPAPSLCESVGSLSVGSFCESISSIAIGGNSLSTILNSLTTFSQKMKQSEQDSGSNLTVDGTLGTFQSEIQRCIEN